jgi:hypothetical protein
LQLQHFRWIEIDADDRLESTSQRLSQQFTWRPDIGDIGKIPRHRLHAVFKILPDAIEQKRRRPATPRTFHPRAQQCAVKQDRCGGRGRSHAGWYAGYLSLAILRLSAQPTGASLAPWTPRHHHHAPFPAICAAH